MSQREAQSIGSDVADPAVLNPLAGVLQEYHLLFQVLFEESAVGMMILSLDDILVRVNPAMAQMLGYEIRDLTGRHVSFINTADGYAHSKARRMALLQQRRSDSFVVEKQYLHRSGRHLWASLTVTLVRPVSGPPFFIGIVQDLSDRRRLEAALQDASENERQRLGRELHEGLGQELAGLSLLAAGLERVTQESPQRLSEELKTLSEIAASAVNGCRAIAHRLAPLTPDYKCGHQDFLNALQHLKWLHRSGRECVAVTVEERCTARLGLGFQVRLQLYRIVEEAVSTAIHQFRATAVSIECVIDAETVRLTVADDGCAAARGMPFSTIMDRALAICARVTVQRSADGGGMLSIEIRNRAEIADRVRGIDSAGAAQAAGGV